MQFWILLHQSCPDIKSSGVSHLLTTERDFLVLSVSYFHFVSQQTIRELFDMNDGEKKEVAVEVSVPQADEEETVIKQGTTILEQVREVLFPFNSVLNTLSHVFFVLL